MRTVEHLEWHGCYDDSWDGFIVPEAFAHPAKFARGLITKIYVHMLAERMLAAGDTVVDPFGGIASGGIVAASWGLRWLGCELEQKFVDLGQRNIAMHWALWESFKDPVPVLVQGDSRKLRENLRGVLADCCVSSPPFLESLADKPSASVRAMHGASMGRAVLGDDGYGVSPGQLAAMKSGSVDSVVSSPPYAECLTGDNTARETAEESRAKRRTEGGSLGQSCRHQGYGGPGNLGNLPSGTVDSVVSSPPYAECPVDAYGKNPGGGLASGKGNHHREWAHGDGYGSSPGQLSALPVGQVDACVTSPPYEGSEGTPSGGKLQRASGGTMSSAAQKATGMTAVYGESDGQLGHTIGETFWSAARDIVAECYAILKPGGFSAWVCKDFVRNKQRVPFCDDWCKLLESQGFVVTTRVHAMLVKETRHADLFGGDDHVHKKERKSFFRRLAEKKGSPRIDFEEVIFARRPE